MTTVSLLRRARLTSTANMCFCDGAGNVGGCEIRKDGVTPYAQGTDAALHTNHFITPELTQYNTQEGTWEDSTARLARIKALVGQRWGRIDVPALKEMLADHEDCPEGARSPLRRSRLPVPQTLRSVCPAAAAAAVVSSAGCRPCAQD